MEVNNGRVADLVVLYRRETQEPWLIFFSLFLKVINRFPSPELIEKMKNI